MGTSRYSNTLQRDLTTFPHFRIDAGDMVKIHREADKHPVADVAKKHGISDQTLYVWRKRYGQLDAAVVKQLRALEAENARLKKLLAERDLSIEIMKEINAKKWCACRYAAIRCITRTSAACR